MNIEFPNILIISNNSFSFTKNNGKTLWNIFKNYPHDKLSQLYFNSETPEISINSYFKITDMDLLDSIVKQGSKCGKIVRPDVSRNEIQNIYNKTRIIPKTQMTRYFRELIWKTKKWKSKHLNNWLDEIKPQVIFFLAGDSAFAYDICQYIKNRYNTELFSFVTDDYYMPRATLSPFFWMRRLILVKEMNNILASTLKFYTISQRMQKDYKELFGKDSKLLINMTEPLFEENIIECKENNKYINLVYTGNIYYGRGTVLKYLANEILKFNLINRKKAFLSIYSTQSLTKKEIENISVNGASKFCGALNEKELKSIYNSCDILVVVESFKLKDAEKVKMSFSTKIAEYLSVKKPILAIGSCRVNSIQYLKQCAICINSKKQIQDGLNKLLKQKNYRINIGEKCGQQFHILQKSVVCQEEFYEDMQKSIIGIK